MAKLNHGSGLGVDAGGGQGARGLAVGDGQGDQRSRQGGRLDAMPQGAAEVAAGATGEDREEGGARLDAKGPH
jgi:hypothetical protein